MPEWKTSATLFSTDVVDSTGFEDRNYTMSMHMNWHINGLGDLITAESGKHHWLQEGFATYAALAERDMEMIISILNYTKQRSKLNMLNGYDSGSQ
jgi:hypothetical protein